MNIILLQFFIAFILGRLSVEIRKGKCNDGPYDICRENGKIGVIATNSNLEELTSMLKNNNIPNAYVYGWNDHHDAYVLWQNGCLAPYDRYNNLSKYAFCAINCPCPRDNVVYSTSPKVYYDCKPKHNLSCYETSECCARPSKHHQTKPWPPREDNHHHRPQHRFKPCHPHDDDHHRRPCCPPRKWDKNMCESSEVSCSESSSDKNECPIFVNQETKTFKNKNKCNSGRPFAKSETISCSKNYSFECSRRGSSFILNSYEQTNVQKCKQFEIKEGKTDCKNLGLPEILCCPSKLIKIKEYLEHTSDCPVCLYIDDCSRVYALIEGRLFMIKQKKRRHHYKNNIQLERVHKRGVRKLIKKGLFGVTFDLD